LAHFWKALYCVPCPYRLVSYNHRVSFGSPLESGYEGYDFDCGGPCHLDREKNVCSLNEAANDLYAYFVRVVNETSNLNAIDAFDEAGVEIACLENAIENASGNRNVNANDFFL